MSQLEPIDRRRFLSGAGRALLLLAGAPLALSACGQTVPEFVDRVGYQLDAAVGEGTASLNELVPLLRKSARARGMDPVLNQVSSGRMASLLGEQTSLGPYDPQTNRRPPVNRLVVVSAVEPPVLEPVAARALGHGVKVVPFPRPLRNQTAAVVFDTSAAAAALARAAASWASSRLGGRGRVMLVLPPSECAGENPLCSEAVSIEQAWRSTFARQAPSLQVSSFDQAVGELGGAEELAPLVRRRRVQIVLAWSDEVATGLSRALRHDPSARASLDEIFVGALGAPTIVSHASIAELELRGPLRVLVAARLGELAQALVDLPHALLRGAAASSVELAPWALTPGSAAAAAYGRDYASRPASGTIDYEGVSLNPSAFH